MNFGFISINKVLFEADESDMSRIQLLIKNCGGGEYLSFSSVVIVNLNSIAILAIIFIQYCLSSERNLLQRKLFMWTLQVTALMLILDVFSRLDGHPGTFYSAANWAGNFLVFFLGPFLPSLWLLYVHSQVSSERKKWLRWMYAVSCPIAVNAALLVFSQFFGWYYIIGPDNVYHRGPLFWLPVTLNVLLAAAAYLLVILNRGKIEPRYFLSLVLFPIPPLICAALQFFLVRQRSHLKRGGPVYPYHLYHHSKQAHQYGLPYRRLQPQGA